MSLRALAAAAVVALGCGGGSGSGSSTPPLGAPIARTEGTPIAGASEWTWIPFPDAFCTDATMQPSGAYAFGTSTTGLAIDWGSTASTDLVIFLQGGGACWDYFTCGGAPQVVPKTAATGPFGPAEFTSQDYDKFPRSWARRANLPAALRDATIVFVPYCTGDVHAGDKVTTYAPPVSGLGVPGLQPITWHHVGHANLMAFLKRLAATFPNPGKLVVSGSSAGGFGTLANYTAIRAYWPDAKSYLVDDSGPPLVGDAIPPSTRSAWFSSWNMGASLDSFCPECRTDMSGTLREIVRRYPQDRVALVSHLHDLVIRGFFSAYELFPVPRIVPMSADEFEGQLRHLGTTVLDPATANGKYFFTAGEEHPTLEDPTAIATPAPGLEAWLELMLSDAPGWASASD